MFYCCVYVATKNFDLKLILKESAVKAGEAKEFMFSSIDRAEYRNLVEYMESKSLNVVKPQEVVKADLDLGEDDDDEDEDGSEDGDYQAPASDDDDDDMGSGDESGSGSDNDGAGGGSGSEDEKPKAKAKKEKEVKAKKEKAPTKAAAKKRTRDEDEDGGKKKRQKKEKKEKDPNAPKGATTSFMLFSNTVRGQVRALLCAMPFRINLTTCRVLLWVAIVDR
jgi:structure-specific recognition protein 1